MRINENHAGRSVLSKNIISAAIIAGLALSGAAVAAKPTTPVITQDMQRALQRDLGISAKQIPRLAKAERVARAEGPRAKREFGANYGGSWMERGANGNMKFVVATTGQVKSATMGGAEVRQVRYGVARLEAAVAKLSASSSRSITAKQPGIQTWRIDLPSNSVVVTVAPDAMDSGIDFVAASGVETGLVRLETSKYAPKPASAIIGGNHYYMSTGGWCSIGFAVTRDDESGYVTAGHCGTAGTWVSGYDGSYLGYFEGSSFPYNDFAFVNTTYTSWYPTPYVHDYNGGLVQVYGSWEAPVGSVVCRSGARTGYRCGYITARDVAVNYGASGVVYGLTQSSACVGGGDSGGSFITPYGQAQGVTSGGALDPSTNENCSLASPVTFDQPVNPILWTYGLTLQL